MREKIQESIRADLQAHLDLFAELQKLSEEVSDVAAIISESIQRKGKLLLCGNGGSAADCQHIAAEFTGRFVEDRIPLPALALTTDSSALTCIGNDYSFEDIFSRQVKALGLPGDCLLAISTSGNSENVIQAVKAAKENDVYTIGLLGRDGGLLASYCDYSIIVPSDVTARVQEGHIFIGHAICGAVEKILAHGRWI